MGSSRVVALTLAACAVACAHRAPPRAPASVEFQVRAPPPPPDTVPPESVVANPLKAAKPVSTARRRASPATIARAGARPLDPAARGAPFAWPTHGVLISGFGERDTDRHDGIDLAAPEGTNVVAAADGTVLFAGEQRGYGNLILLAHAGDVVTVYAHNAQNLVVPGDKVSRGNVIARVGRTGNASGPHVHFEVRVAARPHDPLGFLR